MSDARETRFGSFLPPFIDRANTPVSHRKRILFVSHEASRTGAPILLLDFLRWLRKNTDQEFEMLLGADGPLENEFAKLGVVHKPQALALRPEQIRKFDLIYSNTCCNGLLLEQLGCGNIPIITHFHELDYGMDCNGARNIATVIKQTNHFITCAEACAESFHRRFRVPRERISVHYEMISPSQMMAKAKAVSPGCLRKQFGLPEDALILAGCGTFDLRKAPDLFLQLAARLQRETFGRPLRFVWIGKRNGVEPGRILDHDVRRLGLQEQVKFVGELESPHALLALADIFCLTSREDPFPLVMLEAAALGKPMVCFDGSGGAADFCKFGGGVAVPYLDVAAMAEACSELLKDSARRKSIGDLAAKAVRERFEVETSAPRLWREVEGFLNQPPPMRLYRARSSSLVEVFKDWKPDEMPDQAYVRNYVARREACDKASALLNAGKRKQAIETLVEAVRVATATDDARIMLESLLEFAEAFALLDSAMSAKILNQAKLLAQRLKQPLSDSTKENLKTTAPMEENPRDSKFETKKVQPAAVSVVIPTFNNLALTRKCLDTLFATTCANCEIIVVDNASTDGSLEFLRERECARQLRLISNSRNEGFARACNQGAQAARSPLLLFLNNDTETTTGWLDALVAAVQLPGVGVAGAKLLYADDTVQHAGIGFIGGVPDHPYRHAPADAAEANQFRELDMVTGACLLIQRELFIQLAGFDETYRNGVEDIDLCLRARAAGWKVAYEPKAVVYHLEGQSAGRFNHVSDNLRIFFERWGKSFDSRKNFIVPKPVRIVTASRSLLLASAEQISVAWSGSFLDHGSLSHVNRELTGALQSSPEICLKRISNGALASPDFKHLAGEVSTVASKDVAVTVRHAWPPDWKRPENGKLVVIQPWEFGSLPEQWAEHSANVDEFWAPSEYVRRVYVESGVPANKVVVVPNGVDLKKFHPQVEPMKLATQKKFKFLFVGGTIFRKGPDLLLKAYLENFTAADDACLVIKDFGGKSVYAGQTVESQIRAAQALPNAPEILYLDEELPPDSLPGLYAACDCLVLPYRGEGFGLPVLEAMACGLPVIVTAGGATDDFVRDEFAWRIPAERWIFGHEVSGLKLANAGWLLKPDASALGRFLREAFANPAEARRRGQLAARHAKQSWSWQNAAAIAAQRLRELGRAGLPAGPDARQRVATAKTAPVVKIKITLPPCALAGHLAEARELVRQKKFRAAWAAAMSALAKRPFHPEAFLLLAEIAQSVGAGQTAKLCAEHARRLAPGWKPARKFLNQRLNGGARPEWLKLPDAVQGSKPEVQNLSVCLIVKNEERFLGQCLKSVREIASQIVVVDTGSTDRTIEIAKEFGAEIHSFAWCDDFSAARNAALEHATGDWVLMLDADEELSAAGLEKLKRAMNDSAVMAWRLPIVDVGREADGCSHVPRFYRNAPGLFYIGRVHEQVFSSLEVRRGEWGLENRIGDATLIHHGYTAELTRDRNKIERNLRLLERAVEELPDEPHLLMNLGLELARSGREAGALGRYREAFDSLSSKPAAEIVPELRETLLMQLCTRLTAAKQFDEVVRVLHSPLAGMHGGLTASLHFSLGLAQLELRQFSEAADQMRQCLAKRQQRSLAPINREINTAAPHHCLALCLVKSGEAAAAEKAFQDGLKETGHGDALRLDYARFLAEQNRPVDALHRLNEVVAGNALHVEAWQLGGQIALGRPEFLEFARDWTGEAIRQLPDDSIIVAQRAEALLLSQETTAALPLWNRAVNGERPPRAVAAQILCATVTSQTIGGLCGQAEEAAVSRAFVDWYRCLVAAGARDAIVSLNSRVETLRPVLPSAAGILDGVNAETRKNPAAVAAVS
jgi:glycosyltransferase involved in cell wall biosynthesis